MSKKKDRDLKPLRKSNRKPEPTVKDGITEKEYTDMAKDFIEHILPKERHETRERITNQAEIIANLTARNSTLETENRAYERVLQKPMPVMNNN